MVWEKGVRERRNRKNEETERMKKQKERERERRTIKVLDRSVISNRFPVHRGDHVTNFEETGRRTDRVNLGDKDTMLCGRDEIVM